MSTFTCNTNDDCLNVLCGGDTSTDVAMCENNGEWCGLFLFHGYPIEFLPHPLAIYLETDDYVLNL